MVKTKPIRISVTDYEKLLQLQKELLQKNIKCNTLSKTVTHILKSVTLSVTLEKEMEYIANDDVLQNTETIETDTFTFYKPVSCNCSVCESVKKYDKNPLNNKEIG